MKLSLRGMSVAQVLVATAMVGGLSAVVTVVLRQMTQGQKFLDTKAAAANLQQRIAATTQSNTAMVNTMNANTGLAACVNKCLATPLACATDAACPATAAAFQLMDASNSSLVPLSSGTLTQTDDSGAACDPALKQSSCRWIAGGTFLPSARGDTLRMTFDIASAPAPAGAEASTPMKPLHLVTDVPLSLFSTLGGNPYVVRAGDSMAGTLTLLTPTQAGHGATKGYVDSTVAMRTQRTGDTMAGSLVMPSGWNPTGGSDVATKAYVDAAAGGGGGACIETSSACGGGSVSIGTVTYYTCSNWMNNGANGMATSVTTSKAPCPNNGGVGWATVSSNSAVLNVCCWK